MSRRTQAVIGHSHPTIHRERSSLSAFMLICWIWPLRTATSTDDSQRRRTLLALPAQRLGKETLETMWQISCEKRAREDSTGVTAVRRSSLASLKRAYVKNTAISTRDSSV